MRIGIDVRHLASGPPTGIAVVTCALLEALARAAPNDIFRILAVGRNAPPPVVARWEAMFPNVEVRTERMSNRVFDLRAKLVGSPDIDTLLGGIDVLFSPHAMLAPLLQPPRVLTVHDLSFVAHREFFSPKSRRWHAFMGIRAQARRAAAIIVPSFATARDLMRLWEIPSEKIHIIPWGVPSFRQMADGPPSAPRRDARGRGSVRRPILFLGTLEYRKNVGGLLRAFAILRRDPVFHDTQLILAGAQGFGSETLLRELRAFGDAVAVLGYVPCEEKEELLAKAQLFVYPSFYEGFGLPVLEAMTAGVPVVTSRATSLPEVVGDAALLVDPTRPEEIAAAMRMILTDRALAEALIRRGRERAAQFTWERAARHVLSVLRSVAAAARKSI